MGSRGNTGERTLDLHQFVHDFSFKAENTRGLRETDPELALCALVWAVPMEKSAPDNIGIKPDIASILDHFGKTRNNSERKRNGNNAGATSE